MIGRSLFFANPAHLSFSQGQLKVERKDYPLSSVPLEDVQYIILEHPHISCSTYLLQELAQRNICTIVCNAQYHPVGMMMSLDANQVQSERFRAQLSASEPLKKNLWMQTVKAKIRNQAALLKKIGANETPLLTRARKVRSGDPENEEGRAAAMYWPQLFGQAFRRERYGDSPNELLNYGYAILRAAVARALAGSGLHPTLGIYHRNKYNAYCLADDIMEPYRPFVDSLVLDIQERTQFGC